MAKAVWNGVVIAESDETVIVEGNHYFPPSSVKQELFIETDRTTVCPWKGTANYFTIEVDGATNENGAFIYRTPKEAAAEIAGYLAFWNGVKVEA